MEFEKRVAVVTGASRGIGRQVAIQLAEEGAKVFAIGTSASSLMEFAHWAEENGLEIYPCVCNVSDEGQVNKTAEEILNKFGKVDILVNNAGLWRTGNGPFVQSDSANWRKKIEINVLGTMYFTRALIANMIQNRYGRVVNVSSVAGVYGIRNMVDYSTTKGAINAFTLALAKEVTEFGVTVNSVSPGNILSDSNLEKDNPELSFAGRSGTNKECADVICFLASEKASYISGQNYIDDGCRKKM